MNRVLKLNEVCSEIIDCPHKTPKWLNKGVPVIRNYNLVNGIIDFSNLSYVDEETYKDRTKRIVPAENDILFSREAPIGNCAIIPKNFKCCMGQRLVLLRANPLICSPKYLLAALRSNFVKFQIEQITKRGSIASNFDISDLKDLLIPIIDDYEKVAEFDSYFNEKIICNSKIRMSLSNISKTIYDYWFNQFEFPNDQGRPYKSFGGEMIWSNELKKQIPKSWKTVAIKEILEENPKSKIQVKQATSSNDIYPFFTSGNNTLCYKESFVDGFNIFLNTGGNAGIKSYYGKAAYSTDTWCIKSIENYSLYLFMVLKSMEKYIDQNCFAGSSLQHLQKDHFKNIKIVLPPIEIVKKFNEFLDAAFRLSSKFEREDITLNGLRDFLLPMLMNGQVHISD